MAGIVSITTMIAISGLYLTALSEQRSRLVETAQSQARLIEAVARYDREQSKYLRDENPEYDPSIATLSQITDAHAHYAEMKQTGEFTLARLEADTIKFLLRHRHVGLEQSLSIPFNSTLAEPMRRALAGRSGTVRGLDYRGIQVLAAYEPVGELNLGLVAKVDLAEIRAPFIRAGLVVMSLSLLLIVFGTALFTRISNPILRQIQVSEERYRGLVEQASDGIFICDPTGLILNVNPAGCALLGGTIEDFQGINIREFLQNDEADEDRLQLNDITGEKSILRDFEVPRKDGSIILVEISAIKMSDGNIHGIVRDISERRRAEEALRINEEKYRQIVELSPLGIAIHDHKRRYLAVNPAYCKMFGRSEEDLIAKDYVPIRIPERNREREIVLFDRLTIKQPKIEPFESINVRADGQEIIVRFFADYTRDKDGNFTGFVVFGEDVTDRKRAEEALKESLDYANNIVDSSFDMIIAVDNRRRIIEYNRAAEKTFGYTREEVIGKHVNLLWANPKEGLAIHKKTIKEGHHVQEILNRRKNGGLFPCLLSTSVLHNTSGQRIGVMGVSRDITEQQQSKQIQQVLLDISQAAAITDNLEALINSVREHLGKILDTTNFYIALYDKSSGGFTFPSYFDQHDDWGDTLQFLPNGPTNYVRRTGKSKLWVEETSSNGLGNEEFELHGTYSKCWLGVPLTTSHGVIGVLAIQSYDDPQAYTEDDKKVLDSLVGSVALALERKQAQEEREKLIKDLEQKNTEMERFNYTVSHDLKSPLITIKGFTDLLEKELVKENKQDLALGAIKHVNTAVDRMRLLLDDLLALSRVGRLMNPPEEFALGLLVDEVLEQLSGPIDDGKVHREIDPDLPTVSADRSRIFQVIQNLIENGIKFMGDQKEPLIKIGSRKENGAIVIFVQDNGIGINPEYHNRIFNLFQQLHPSKDGSGVGLTMVKRIIEFHKGRLWVESDGLGEGSTFCFTLPTSGASTPVEVV